MSKINFILRDELDELERVSGDLDSFLERNGVPGDTVFHVHFVIEEMVSNVIKYAFSDSATHEISLEISAGDEGLDIIIEDDGIEFDPLSVPEKKTDLPLHEREIGGLGIHLVRKMVKDMSYVRRGGRNRLCLRIGKLTD